jgi:GNAT superfamily N-acetyltransferase
MPRIELLSAGEVTTVEAGLAMLLMDCVVGGASVGFLADLGDDEARAWWRQALSEPDSLTWVAWSDDGRIVGVVRLTLATKPNARHRAEVAKLLVHRDARGRGCAGALMSALEGAARGLGRCTCELRAGR